MASAFDPSRFIVAEAARATAQGAAERSALPTLAGHLPAVAEPSSAPLSAPAEGQAANFSRLATLAGGGLHSREWFADLQRFVDARCPDDIRPEAWDELTGEAWNVARRWSDDALAHGWTSLDLFACNPNPRAARVDRNGLVMSIVCLRTAVKLVEITREVAVMETADHSRSRLRKPRGQASGAVHLWDAYPMQGGP